MPAGQRIATPAGQYEPAVHRWHAAAPAPLKKPDVQGVHASAPFELLKKPAPHALQPPGAPLSMHVPALQLEEDDEHVAAPEMLVVPLGHTWHAAPDVLLDAALYVMAGHGVVALAPMPQYEPCGQG